MEAPKPDNENDRLVALHGLDILDTPPEETFDRITRLAALFFGVPIALVSLVDSGRQWFKSSVGLEVRETSRDIAFCSHTILGADVMAVVDAQSDDRFESNPLVQGPPGIRFYAGAPLIVDGGIRIGTLCVIDTEPRNISRQERQSLRDLAAVVVDELSLRRAVSAQAHANQELAIQAKELRLANQGLEQFAYMASHDLRAPIKKVVNLADLGLVDESDRPEMLRAIRRSGMELEAIIAGYLRLAKLECVRSEERTVGDLVEAGRRQIDHRVDVEVLGEATVACDAALMAQAMANLIDNAGRYGSDRRITFAVDGSAERTRILARNAIDRPLPVDQSVFIPFRRLTADGEGVGLGLAVVDRIVQLHGGSVFASSDGGQFAVSLDLPARVA